MQRKPGFKDKFFLFELKYNTNNYTVHIIQNTHSNTNTNYTKLITNAVYFRRLFAIILLFG